MSNYHYDNRTGREKDLEDTLKLYQPPPKTRDESEFVLRTFVKHRIIDKGFFGQELKPVRSAPNLVHGRIYKVLETDCHQPWWRPVSEEDHHRMRLYKWEILKT